MAGMPLNISPDAGFTGLQGLLLAQKAQQQGVANAYQAPSLAQHLLGMQITNALNKANVPYAGLLAQANAMGALGKGQLAAFQGQNPGVTLPGAAGAVAAAQWLQNQMQSNAQPNTQSGASTFGNGLVPSSNNATTPTTSNATNAPTINPPGTIPLTVSPADAQKLQQIYPQANQGVSSNMPTGSNIAPGGLVNMALAPYQRAAADAQLKNLELQNYNYQKLTPEPIKVQMYYEKTLENQLANGMQFLPSISKYFGAAGQAALKVDQAKVAAGYPASPEYTAYQQFMTQNLPTIANEYRKAIGDNATDKTNEVMSKIVSPDFWINNPQTAMAMYQNLFQILRTNAGATATDPTKITQEIENLSKQLPKSTGTNQGFQGQKKLNQSLLTPENLAHTAQKYNMTVPQLKAYLQSQGAL